MKQLPPTLLAALSLTAGACLAVDDDLTLGERQEALAEAPGEEVRTAMRGTKLVIPPEYETMPTEDVPAPTAEELSIFHAGTIVYMNRGGGTYTPGNNDARTNRSTIVQQTSSVPAWNVDDATWNTVMSCVRGQFSPFDVEITDVDPGNVPHYESVVAGSPGDVGMPNNVGGVSPFTSNCSIIDNSIVFTFANALPQNPQLICEIVAQEVAHSFGLDHEYLSSDNMTYLESDAPKSFQDTAAPCGEYQARGCRVQGQYDCGTETQNSYQLLSQRLGLRDDDLPPTLAITTPADGAVVAPGFAIAADVTDDGGITEVELLIDGVSVDSTSDAPFEFTAPGDLDPGTHVVEIIARDGSGESTDSIAVELQEGGDEGDTGGQGGDGSGSGPGPQRPNAGVVGGCSAAGGAGAGLAWLLLACAPLLRSRRRR